MSAAPGVAAPSPSPGWNAGPPRPEENFGKSLKSGLCAADSSQGEVLSAPAAAVWLCPDCGHGSPERRDARAHLDAHRQLRAFLDEWEAGTEAGAARRGNPGGPVTLLYALLAALVLFAGVVVFARVNAADDSLRRPPPSGPVPSVAGPATSAPTVAAPVPSTSATVPARARSTAPVAAPARPAQSAQEPPAPSQPQPVAVTPVPAPPTTAATSVQPEPAPYLLQACMLGLCLRI